ncbi:MAG: fatty acid desaturase [Chitinophagaceae bacterium]
MLTGKQLILATKPYAQEQRARSWYELIVTLCALFAAGFVAAYGVFWPLRLTGSIFMALLMMRMFIIYHDYEHHTILQKSKAAKLIMSAYGYYMLTPPSIWKRSHDYHHKNNSKLFSASIGSYPIATRKKFAAMTRGERFTYLANRHPVSILSGYLTIFIYGMCVGSFISTPKKHFDSLIALLLHAAYTVLIIAFAGVSTWMFLIFLPFLLTCAMGSYLFYAQHNFPGVMFNCNEDWTYEKAALESSSYLRTNKMMQWFSGNIGFHHIHHLNARIPFYRLPEVYAAIPELRHAKETSFRLQDIAACLRLKLWDPETQRMISLKEFNSENETTKSNILAASN